MSDFMENFIEGKSEKPILEKKEMSDPDKRLRELEKKIKMIDKVLCDWDDRIHNIAVKLKIEED